MRRAMRRRIDEALHAQVNHKRLTETELNERLRDWGLHGDPEAVFDAWQVWKVHHVLPFAGGWLEQPWWVRDDFATLNAVEAWHELQAEKPDIPKENPFANGRNH